MCQAPVQGVYVVLYLMCRTHILVLNVFGGNYSVCSYRFGVSKGGDKIQAASVSPDQSFQGFVTEAEHYHVTVGWLFPSGPGRTEAPSSIVVVIVCVCVCACLHTKFFL